MMGGQYTSIDDSERMMDKKFSESHGTYPPLVQFYEGDREITRLELDASARFFGYLPGTLINAACPCLPLCLCPSNLIYLLCFYKCHEDSVTEAHRLILREKTL